MKEFNRKNQRQPLRTASHSGEIERKLLSADIGPLVRLTHLRNIDFLGQGSYAFVKLAYEASTDSNFALKIFEKKTLVVKRRLQNLLVS